MILGNCKCTFWVLILVSFASCSDSSSHTKTKNTDNKELVNNESTATSTSAQKKLPKQFDLLESKHTGLDFKNTIKQNSTLNTLYYTYLFNGGGVGAGDINNDGLVDLYFCGNQVPNKLFLNKGNMQFEDITESAGVDGQTVQGLNTWSSGVCLVDINNDGYLDLYVVRGGPHDWTNKANLLYINNKNLTFTEQAAKFGIDDKGFGTHATFFDADNDNDLDLYVLNHPVFFQVPIHKVYETLNANKTILPGISGKLYKNNGKNGFVDVTENAGLLKYGYGLGVNASDINQDGWVDLYVSNDFSGPDFMFINQKNGTFKDEINSRTKHISYYGMGCDIADINNDGFHDIIVVDMTADDNYRNKTLMPTMQPHVFHGLHEQYGFQYQYMFNTLQVNAGNGTFTELGQFAGISKTDWSWSPHLVDFNNDGFKDLFVTNGWLQDTKNNDFLTKYRKRKNELGVKKMPEAEIMDWVQQIPSHKTVNYMYSNTDGYLFKDESNNWGITKPSFSNGAAIADLDNDGDMDIVVSNIDDPPFIYKNENGAINNNNYLKVKLSCSETNTMSLNAIVSISTDKVKQMAEFTPYRGYASSSQPLLHFGIGEYNVIDKLAIKWLDGTTHLLENVQANQVLSINKADANNKSIIEKKSKPLFTKAVNNLGINFSHSENTFNEYEKEILLPHSQSSNSPLISVGDVNKDDLMDFYIGGAHQQAAQLYLQQTNGQFLASNQPLWNQEAQYEDAGSVFFDLENDGDLDLYVVSSGGGEMTNNLSYLLQDRVYINDGNGNYSKLKTTLPVTKNSGHRVAAADYDNDGYTDLFVSGRLSPGAYPKPVNSYLLNNNKGILKDVTQQQAKPLIEMGMVTDAVFNDIDNDQDLDLIVVGDWMPISILENTGNEFTLQKEVPNSTGWWNRIIAADFNNDGISEFVCGNFGLNNKFVNKPGKQIHLYADDFDNNNTLDIVLAKNYQGNLVPVRGKQCSSEQMPFINAKYADYESFAQASLGNILGKDKLQKAIHVTANQFQSSILTNNGKGNFKLAALPNQVQTFPIKGITIVDVNKDNFLDLVVVGNHYNTEVETIRYDAGLPSVLLGNGKNSFSYLPSSESGFFINADFRDVVSLTIQNKLTLLIASNNDKLNAYQL